MSKNNNEVTVYAPATVANVVCGFDILGFALSQPHDQMVVRISNQKGVTIINKDAYDLPTDATKNVSRSSPSHHARRAQRRSRRI
jgi:homoserine kinase